MPEDKLFTTNALAGKFDTDRRTLKRWLKNVDPDGRRDGNPVYKLATVAAIVKERVAKRRAAATAREKLTLAQTEKILTWIAIQKREWLPAKDVAQWAAELAGAIRKVVMQVHLLAPNIVGLNVPDAEALLKDKEDEILEQLHLIDQHIQAANENQPEKHEPAGEGVRSSIQAHGETPSELLRE